MFGFDFCFYFWKLVRTKTKAKIKTAKWGHNKYSNCLKAKAMDIDFFQAAANGRMADVQLVCQYAPEKVNDKHKVSCCCTPTHC